MVSRSALMKSSTPFFSLMVTPVKLKEGPKRKEKSPVW